LWGTDLDSRGVAFLAERGFSQLVACDAERIDEATELSGRTYDVIVATELLEHLSNPGLFLDSVGQLMMPGLTNLVVSVPNAFRLPSLLHMLRRVEYVHPDHVRWYSYVTLLHLLDRHGYEIRDLVVYGTQPGWHPARVMSRLLYRLNPFWANGLIASVVRRGLASGGGPTSS